MRWRLGNPNGTTFSSAASIIYAAFGWYPKIVIIYLGRSPRPLLIHNNVTNYEVNLTNKQCHTNKDRLTSAHKLYIVSSCVRHRVPLGWIVVVDMAMARCGHKETEFLYDALPFHLECLFIFILIRPSPCRGRGVTYTYIVYMTATRIHTKMATK